MKEKIIDTTRRDKQTKNGHDAHLSIIKLYLYKKVQNSNGPNKFN